MPRVNVRVKNSAGREIRCGRCGEQIKPGEKYFRWSFRYGGARTNCFRHPPRPSETTQSIIGEVYAAVESAQDSLAVAESIEDITSAVEEVAEAARGVFDQYTTAAESFGGGGENGERAAELEPWVDELDNWEPEGADEPSDEVREEAVKAIVAEVCDPDVITWDDLDAVIAVFSIDEGILEERMVESNAAGDALEAARESASELVGNCPL